MEENNKPTSELENVVNEATEVKPVSSENQEEKNIEVENEVETSVEVPAPQPKAAPKVKKSSKTDNIQVVDDSSSVELPQTKEGIDTTTPTNVSSSAPNSQVIGTIKPDKQKSPIAMLVLFGVLILFIVFMPTAISLVNKFFGTNLNVDSLNNTTKVDIPKTDDKEKQEIKMYHLKEDTVIKIDKIDIGGFKKDNDNGPVIKFYIKNNGTQMFKFEKKLYLEFYDNNNTFMGRTYLENVKEITGGITNNYSYVVNNAVANSASKVEVIQRTEDDYPAVSLTNNILTCTNTTDNLVYTFDSSSNLTNIKDMFTYTKDEDVVKYSNDLLTYKTKVSNLDALEGVTSVLTESDTGFITTTAIDYQSADYSKLPTNSNYYNKDTAAKIVSFEMNAKGYTCR